MDISEGDLYCPRGQRQRIIATLGELPGMGRNERVYWDKVRRIVRRIREKGLYASEEGLDIKCNYAGETFFIVRKSKEHRGKERAMLARQKERLEKELRRIQQNIRNRKVKAMPIID